MEMIGFDAETNDARNEFTDYFIDTFIQMRTKRNK